MMMKRLTVSCLLMGLVACSDNNINPESGMRRPSGLVVAERPVGSQGEHRSDLFIADSEAEAIRVRQNLRVVTQGRKGPETVNRSRFLRAPLPFFPLAIMAPGFPERLALSDKPSHDRLFVLSPAGSDAKGNGLLHVLQVDELPYGTKVDETTPNRSLGSFSLETYAGAGYLPVDIQTLGYDAAGDVDFVGVLFQSLVGQASELLVFPLKRTQTGFSVGKVQKQSLGLGSQRFIRLSGSRLLASSSLGSELSELSYTLSSTVSEGLRFGSVRQVDAGGPTTELIDGGSLGVFAVRLDRSALAVFEDAGGQIVRSTRHFNSPFWTDAMRVTPPEGEIILDENRPVVGAKGQLKNLYAQGTDGEMRSILPAAGEAESDKLHDVVALFHIDGQVSFLVPDASGEVSLAKTSSAAVSRLRRLPGPSDVRIQGCASQEALKACAPAQALGCEASMLPYSYPEDREYQAKVKGELFDGVNGQLERQSLSGGAGVYTMPTPKHRFVQVGDQVELQERFFPCQGEAVATEGRFLGEVQAVDDTVLTLAFTQLPEALTGCEASQATINYKRLRIFPAGEEAVLSRMDQGEIVEVLQRAPLTGSGASRSAQFGGLSLSQHPMPLRFEMQGDLRCLGEGESPSTDASTPKDWLPGSICSAQRNCGNVRRCVPATTEDAGCFEVCEAECTAESCLREDRPHFCAGLHMIVRGVKVASSKVDVGYRYNVYGGVARSRASAPSQAVFSSIDGAWMVSYPSSRALASVRPTSDGIIVEAIR